MYLTASPSYPSIENNIYLGKLYVVSTQLKHFDFGPATGIRTLYRLTHCRRYDAFSSCVYASIFPMFRNKWQRSCGPRIKIFKLLLSSMHAKYILKYLPMSNFWKKWPIEQRSDVSGSSHLVPPKIIKFLITPSLTTTSN